MNRIQLGRSDLLRCLGAEAGDPGARFVGRLCGYQVEAKREAGSLVSMPVGPEAKAPISEPVAEPVEAPVRKDKKREVPGMRFWLAATLELVPKERVDQLHTAPEHFSARREFQPGDLDWRKGQITGRPLLPWARLWPFLKHALGRRRESRQPDVARLVRLLVRGQAIRRVPRRFREGWHPRAEVLVDRREELAPCWDDYEFLIGRLLRLRGNGGLKLFAVREHDGVLAVEPWDSIGRQAPRAWRPAPDRALLVLGDLGLSGGGPARLWLDAGRQMARAGGRGWALAPYPRDRWRRDMAEYWRMACWDRGHRLPVVTQGQSPWPRGEEANARDLERLKVMLSPAVRVERGLLRDVRLLGQSLGLDIGTELDLWQSPEAAGWTLGFSLEPTELRRVRKQLSGLERDRLVSVVREIRRHHQPHRTVLGPAEILALRDYLSEEQKRALATAGLHHEGMERGAVTFFRRLAWTLAQERKSLRGGSLAAWGDRTLNLLQATRMNEEFQVIWGFARRVLDDQDANDPVPPGYDKERFSWIDRLLEERAWGLGITGRGLTIATDSDQSADYPLCRLVTREPGAWAALRREGVEGAEQRQLIFGEDDELSWDREEVPAELFLVSDRERWAFSAIERPYSFWEMGYDEYGLFGWLIYRGVRLRMRWIPPGRFTMGDDRYGPPHEVVIDEGFWMAETQTTQALWEEVIGVANTRGTSELNARPSRFEGRGRPVERVSWRDVMEFCSEISRQIPDLDFGLPTEAQWEYACRAGAQSDFNDGSACTDGLGHDPALDRLSWFDQNSGRATREVAQKTPNAWGLYDLHGNVREWCLDGQREYPGDGRPSPVGPSGPETPRALRGGGYWSSAGYCRSAFRGVYDPVGRHDSIGFRLVAGRRRRSPEFPASGVIGLWAKGAAAPGLRYPGFAGKPQRGARPAWATDGGRDEYGEWASFRIEKVEFKFRRIPAGEFLMGSADDDSFGYDDERPRHSVRITRAFWMADTPVVREQWDVLRDENPPGYQSDRRPIVNLSWDEAMAFARDLNARTPGLGAGLPTEAQWEYACRAGAATPLNDGNEPANREEFNEALDKLGWYSGNSGNRTQEVRGKSPNGWGIYDLHGNVWEWCLDSRRDYGPGEQTDPMGATEKGAPRVLRGGGYWSNARSCRSAYRNAVEPGQRNDVIGFRLVAGLEAEHGGSEG